MEWFPSENEEVLKLATPATKGTVPSTVAPSLNVTVPVGVPAPGLTVAVSVTCWPKTSEVEEAVSVVVVVPMLTFKVSGRVFEFCGALESDTDTVKGNAPAAKGVPLSTPALESVNPPGSTP